MGHLTKAACLLIILSCTKSYSKSYRLYSEVSAGPIGLMMNFGLIEENKIFSLCSSMDVPLQGYANFYGFCTRLFLKNSGSFFDLGLGYFEHGSNVGEIEKSGGAISTSFGTSFSDKSGGFYHGLKWLTLSFNQDFILIWLPKYYLGVRF